MIWENGIETCIISYVKRVASPGSMHDTGCSGLVQPRPMQVQPTLCLLRFAYTGHFMVLSKRLTIPDQLADRGNQATDRR